jgi:hypothetical protein
MAEGLWAAQGQKFDQPGQHLIPVLTFEREGQLRHE